MENQDGVRPARPERSGVLLRAGPGCAGAPMTESKLWKALHRELIAIGGFGTRLESGATGLGIPDSIVQHPGYRHVHPQTSAWCELKVAPGNAIPDVEGPQAGFGMRAEAAGIRAVVLAWRSPKRVSVFMLGAFADHALRRGDPPEPVWEGWMGVAAVSAVLGADGRDPHSQEQP